MFLPRLVALVNAAALAIAAHHGYTYLVGRSDLLRCGSQTAPLRRQVSGSSQ